MSSKAIVVPLSAAFFLAAGAPFLTLAASPAGAPFPALAASPAAAQTKPANERIMVTGSNIPRKSAQTSSPVRVLTAAEMTKSGYTSVGRALVTEVPQVSGVGR